MEEEDWLEDHEIDGKICYKEMQPICPGCGTGGDGKK